MLLLLVHGVHLISLVEEPTAEIISALIRLTLGEAVTAQGLDQSNQLACYFDVSRRQRFAVATEQSPAILSGIF